MPTQNGTQNTVQNQSQMLFRDESMQVETASTMMALAHHETQTSDGEPFIPIVYESCLISSVASTGYSPPNRNGRRGRSPAPPKEG
jgi:hypothetical protein